MQLKAIWSRIALTAVLVGAVLAGVRTLAQSGWSDSSPAKGHSVVVIGPNSPNIDDVLERWFPGVTGVSNYATVKPLLAIVHNNTLRVVKAYMVKWTITNADGTTATEYLPVVSEPGPGEARLTGERTVLGQGDGGLGTQIVSPYFHWPQRGFAELLQGNAVMISFQTASLKPLAASIQGATRIRTTLDGAIFGDGVFVGPDTSKLCERFQAAQQSEVDEAGWLLSQISGGLTDQQLRQSLSQHIYQGRNSTATDSADLYDAARGEAASRLLSVLDQGGQAALLAVATRLASAKPMTLRKLAGE